jgi:AAA15 family ATPase/GTPase
MAIKDIYIDNFSVFKDTKIEFCEGINVIIGGNGTGKTQLLKFLYALHETAHRKYEEEESVQIYKEITKDKSDTFSSYESIEFINNCLRPYSLYMFLRQSDKSDKMCENEELARINITTTDSVLNELSVFEIDEYPELGILCKGSHNSGSVFIPAKEMLTHATLYNMKEKYGNEMPYDDTYLNVIELARRWKLKETPKIVSNIIDKLQNIIGGSVKVKDDGSFWMQKKDGLSIPFMNEADGFKKFGLLWQLLLNGSIDENTVLFWDEPENSINPEHIPILIEILIELQRQGVQIFLATHNYNIMNYINVKKGDSDKVRYICLKKEDNRTVCEIEDDYNHLSHNPIVEGEIKMYDDEIAKGLS